jgi:aminoglycoside phosphotransferase (APT) family kinase protein
MKFIRKKIWKNWSCNKFLLEKKKIVKRFVQRIRPDTGRPAPQLIRISQHFALFAICVKMLSPVVLIVW